MQAIKASRQFRGSPISIRALSRLEDRSAPLSILDIVSTNGARHFSGKISSGDVDSTWDMSVWQNGFWSVKADFHDGGILAGDFFFAEFILDGYSGIKGVKLEGSILNVVESRHLSLDKAGSDRFVRDNWGHFQGTGPRVRLHIAMAVGGIALGGALILGAVAVVVFGGGSGGNGGSHQMERCPQGTLNVDIPGRDSPCVQISDSQ